MSRFADLASKIRASGKQREWRHTSGGFGSRCKHVEQLYIPYRAVLAGNNTWAYFIDDAETTIAIQYHRTQIIHLRNDGRISVVTDWATVSTKARYREFGLSVWTDRGSPYATIVLGDHTSIYWPMGDEIIVNPNVTAEQSPRIYALWVGCRAGNADASMALAAEFEAMGMPNIAYAARARGRTAKAWGPRPRTFIREWGRLDETVGSTWLVDAESGKLERPLVTRDLCIHSVKVYDRECTIGGKLYHLVDGFAYVGGKVA